MNKYLSDKARDTSLYHAAGRETKIKIISIYSNSVKKINQFQPVGE